MKIKKIVAASLLAAMLSMPAMAIDFVCEPEDDNAVTYSVFFYGAHHLETTFFKYARENNQDEYWIRLSSFGIRDKLLKNITLVIDDASYTLTAVVPDFDVNTVASISLRTGDRATFRSNTRFYELTPEMVQRIITAKTIFIKYDTYKEIRQITPIKDDSMAFIKQAFSLDYKNYPDYWKPRDGKA